MKLPYSVFEGLNENHKNRWEKQFILMGRCESVGLWRRTQCVDNRDKSGWSSCDDMRRRIVHFIDRLGVVKNNNNKYSFSLMQPYLWLHLSFPKKEMDIYKLKLKQSLQAGNWNKKTENLYTRGDVECFLTNIQPKQDKEEGRKFPENYSFLTVTIKGKDYEIPQSRLNEPWDVLKTGIRKPIKRGNPVVTKDTSSLLEYFPAQIELGGGPSIEAGIPPLHYLHEVYYVSDIKDGLFVLDPIKDNLLHDILSNPEEFYKKALRLQLQSLLSEPTSFYKLLKKLFKKGLAVGPVITNNFDGFCSVLEIPEKYVRKYDEAHITPEIDFDKKAKSLLVVGSHADRRRIQESARGKGLKVIYVDPEGYNIDGEWVQHLLEGPQTEDILVSLTAEEFTASLEKHI
ncbi:MAG: hypothetical protein K9M15_00605 [Candidatus Marinimicrobia bacterium]|nr:hypothetical protein [Candidatus Neomarinimicrobiota bacterium]